MVNQLTLSMPRIQYSSLRKVDNKQKPKGEKGEKKYAEKHSSADKTLLSRDISDNRNGLKLDLVL